MAARDKYVGDIDITDRLTNKKTRKGVPEELLPYSGSQYFKMVERPKTNDFRMMTYMLTLERIHRTSLIKNWKSV